MVMLARVGGAHRWKDAVGLDGVDQFFLVGVTCRAARPHLLRARARDARMRGARRRNGREEEVLLVAVLGVRGPVFGVPGFGLRGSGFGARSLAVGVEA